MIFGVGFATPGPGEISTAETFVRASIFKATEIMPLPVPTSIIEVGLPEVLGWSLNRICVSSRGIVQQGKL